MRLFVGIGVSGELERAVAEWVRQHSTLPVRWITAKNLHITLVPPWEGEPESALSLLTRVAPPKGFSLNFHTVSLGPLPKTPRLIWAEGKASLKLVRVRDDLLKAFKVVPEHRKFRLHLTLARFRPEEFSRFPVRQLHDRVEWRDQVRSVRLYRSRLFPGGAEYEVLGEVPCGGGR
jgi:2'-5' RNA ligase